MSFFDSLRPDETLRLAPYLEEVRFAAGERLLEEGTPGDECYLIDAGRVRLELHSAELDSDAVLDYLDEGHVLGEFSLFDHGLRSASAYAETPVVARRLTRTRLDALCREQPDLGNALLVYIAQDFTHKLRVMDERLRDFLVQGLAPPWVNDMIAAAQRAQEELATWPEERIDEILIDLAETIAAEAETLAAETVAETGVGVAAHKVIKIRLACAKTREMLVGQCGSGVQPTDEVRRVTEILCPLGVVLGLVPVTNPVPTMTFKTMICLKSRNALILSCARATLGLAGRVGELMQEVLDRHGAPRATVQWIRERCSRATTAAFMTHPGVSLILATGGPSMVKAAYSSGTPAIGVGAGNAPVWICPDADLAAAARAVVVSKSFDNGVICGSDNNLVVDATVRDEFLRQLEAAGALILSGFEVDRFSAGALDPRTKALRRELVGKSAAQILNAVGLPRGEAVKLIVLPIDRAKVTGPWGREKLAPIVSLFTAIDLEDGLALSRRLLDNMGAGHTAIIHTADRALALRFAAAMPASRVLLNCPGSTGCIGLGNGLRHSWTLGCGSWGGTSTTANVGYQDLLNIKRLAEATEATPV